MISLDKIHSYQYLEGGKNVKITPFSTNNYSFCYGHFNFVNFHVRFILSKFQ